MLRDLDQVLADISTIRSQFARSAIFHGFGPATVAATGLLAVVAAAAQAVLVSNPVEHLEAYLVLWGGTAVLCGGLVGAEMVSRARRVHLGLANQMLWTAIEQFLPAAVAGGLLTIVLLGHAPETTWMLPGLWQVIFSLGVFASCRFLPRPTFWVGAWYLVSGLVALAVARGDLALSPVTMGAGFGVGQLLTAGILYLHREEEDADA